MEYTLTVQVNDQLTLDAGTLVADAPDAAHGTVRPPAVPMVEQVLAFLTRQPAERATPGPRRRSARPSSPRSPPPSACATVVYQRSDLTCRAARAMRGVMPHVLLRIAAVLLVVQAMLLWVFQFHAMALFANASPADFLGPSPLGWLMHIPGRPDVHQDYYEGAVSLAAFLQMAAAGLLWQIGGLSRTAPLLARNLLFVPVATALGCIGIWVGHFPTLSMVIHVVTTWLIMGSFGALVKRSREAPP